ncbi:MFS transporter [Kribbella kalugense]|uniref:DHA1 family inner membrane transport protein n=1 Tax=Kribbella kalugense TaxID=2512221 RepID=A0A4R8A3M4_9ACTN|nr:MFS transporter [Kribbella kalugense]TDW24241.1 DHA1 family inner membrane transport protein [Kribbella kalugense]
MPIALLALAVGAFAIGATEFSMMGILPTVARDLQVTVPQAGYLVSAYAIGVVIGGPLVAVGSRRLARKYLLLVLMTVFTIGNVGAAVSPNYGFLMAARVVTAVPHGAFFGVGSVVAAKLVGDQQSGRAIAVMFSGLTIANIVGVPAATALGNGCGWQLAFAAIAGVGVLAIIAIAILVPNNDDFAAPPMRTELHAFAKLEVWLSLGVGTLGFAGVFATYTYIGPTLESLTGVGPVGLSVAIALFGLGLAIGNLIGGRLADRALLPANYIALGSLAVALALFALAVHNRLTAFVTLSALGFAAGLVIPSAQMWTVRAAGDAPTLAAAATQSGFNIANAGGAALGGAVIGAGLGYTGLSLLGAVLALAGLGLALASARLSR